MDTTKNHDYIYENYEDFREDKFFIDKENQKVEIVYYNPDSSEGGQLVYDSISFDVLKDAFNESKTEEQFWEYLYSYAYQTLIDITSPEFTAEAEKFVKNPCDYIGRTDYTMDELRKLVLPVQEKQDVITIDNIEKFIGKTVDCDRGKFHYYPLSISKTDKQYYYTDRNDVMICFNKGDTIYYDSVYDTPIKLSTKEKLTPVEQAESKLFFRMDVESEKRHGAIGYLRADFGNDGSEFHSLWTDTESALKTPAFKSEFDDILNSLRDDGKEPPFENRKNLAAFCSLMPGTDMKERGDGYMIQTQDFSYFFRCKPQAGDYDIYCFAYDNRWLLPELAGKHELPEVCFSTLSSSGDLITISRYEDGYKLSDVSKPNPEMNRHFADTANKIHGVTKAQEEAMHAGSMFGWSVPAAKPWMYDENGKPRITPHKLNDKER